MRHGKTAAGDDGGRFPRLSIMRGIYDGFIAHGAKRLVVTNDGSCSYADAYMRANALAGYFQDVLGLGPSSSIALSAPNLVHVPIVLAAAQLVGARVALFSSTLSLSEFERGARLVKPQLVIMSKVDHCLMAQEILPDATVFGIDCPAAHVALLEDAIGVFGFDDRLAFPHANADAHIVVFTSGSTGAPKAIVNRASSFARNGLALRKWLELTGDDVMFLPVPLIHVFGLVGLYATLAARASFVTSARYHAAEACALIAGTHATVHLGVATMFIREMRENADDGWDFSSLRAGLVAGASCPPGVITAFEERYGCRIMQSYGMSETAATLTVTPLGLPAADRAATVGFCIEGAQVKADPETGEILCKTPSIMEGVLLEDGTLDPGVDAEGWLHSGDIGVVGEDGMLAIKGRMTDVVIRGGVNVFPQEVEAVYEGNADVAVCCVVGYDDDDLGERLCLCVLMAPGRGDTSTRDLRLYAKGRIDKCKVPDLVLKMEEFPYLDNGKVDKKELKRRVGDMLTAARQAQVSIQ